MFTTDFKREIDFEMKKDSTTLMDDEMKRMFDKIARNQEQRERASIRSLREKSNADSDKDFLKILLTKWWDEADVYDIEDNYWEQSDSFDEGIRTAARQIAEHITLAIVYADNMNDAVTGLVDWYQEKRKTLDDRLGAMASIHLRAQRIKRTEIEITMLDWLRQYLSDSLPTVDLLAPINDDIAPAAEQMDDVRKKLDDVQKKLDDVLQNVHKGQDNKEPATDTVPPRPQGRPSTKDEIISADVQKIFDKAVRDGLMEETDDGYKWTYNSGSNASLSYFIGIVYEWVEAPPQWANMETLFHKKSLKESYRNVTQTKKEQKWRKTLDDFLDNVKQEYCKD